MKYEKISHLKDNKFKRKVGIPRVLFEILVEIIKEEFAKKHKRGGAKPKLSCEDMLLMLLTYYRDYPTFFALGIQFGIDESNAWRNINWMEDVLFTYVHGKNKNLNFNEIINISIFDGKKGNLRLVDVTECTVQRSKKVDIQKEYYSGKKKKHTLKIQIITDEDTKKIISIAFEKGSVHDFNLFKETTESLDNDTAFVADSGYQGIDKIFEKSTTPKKKSKNHPLTEEDKDNNHLISVIRIPIEHVNCQLKIFRILSERYRSRVKTFFIPAILICEFYNLCL